MGNPIFYLSTFYKTQYPAINCLAVKDMVFIGWIMTRLKSELVEKDDTQYVNPWMTQNHFLNLTKHFNEC